MLNRIRNLNSMWRSVEQFNDQYFDGWRERSVFYYGNAMAGEAGEVCNALKKMYGGGTKGDSASKDDLLEEASDVTIYLITILKHEGITLDDFSKAFEKKMKENVERMEARLKQ